MLLISHGLLLLGLLFSGGVSKNGRLRAVIAATLFIHIGLTTIFFVSDYFTGRGLNEAVIYHSLVGLEGAGFGEYLSITLSALVLLFGALASSLLYYFYFWRFLWTSKKTNVQWLCFALLFLSIGVHRTTKDISKIFYQNIQAHLNQKKNTALFNKLYSTQINPKNETPKNLLFIYAESLENTYFDEKLFPGLTSDLNTLEVDYKFNDVRQLWATGWTIAGMFGSQCGLPLAIGYNEMLGATESFYGQAFCLGDFLKSQNYYLSFIQGTSVTFSGIKNIFSSHGFDHIQGSETLQPMVSDPNYKTHWGLYDDSLLPIVKEHFSKINREHKRHATFFATMDTHHPDGHYSQSCGDKFKYQDGKNKILNAVHCSQFLISKFIREIQNSDLSKNLLIVIISDHLAMRNSAIDSLEKGERKNLFWIIDPSKSGEAKVISRPASILDIGSTTLDALGFEGGLGLGRSLLNPKNKTLVEQFREPDLQLQAWRNNVGSLWEMPKITSSDTIEFFGEKLKVKNEYYKYPLVLEIDEDSKVEPSFGPRIYKTLNRIDGLAPFLWVDKCDKVTKTFFKDPIKTSQYCYAIGKLNLALEVGSADSNLRLKGNRLFPLRPDPIQVAFNKENLKNLLPSKVQAHSEVPNYLNTSKYIAHAGGKINGAIYTNSLEALDENYRKGFRYFELDISKTSDDWYVGAHDWTSWKNKSHYKGDKNHIPSLNEFKNTKKKNGLTPMTTERINQWFKEHPGAKLVTDKVNNPRDFTKQFKFKDRLIMELFSPKAVKEALENKIKAMPSWLHVVKKMPQKERLNYFKKNSIRYMSMPIGEVEEHRDFLQKIKSLGVRVYLYHINYKENQDEKYVTCNLLDVVHGMYADQWTFPKEDPCQ